MLCQDKAPQPLCTKSKTLPTDKFSSYLTSLQTLGLQYPQLISVHLIEIAWTHALVSDRKPLL